MHHLVNMAIGFALGYGLARHTGELSWALAGFAIAAGWGLLSLHNDCRYKAFFQRLKGTGRSYRVEGGSGGRPSPPAPWPRRGLGMLTWPAYKLCEPHAVILWLTGLAVLAAATPRLWLPCWQVATLGMATLAPLLGAGRSWRGIRRGSVEEEFDRWFQPEGPG
jgi:hypothetical protein